MKPSIKQLTTAVVLGLVPLVLAHGANEDGGDSMNMDMDISHGAGGSKPDPDSYPPTYFALADHAGLIYAHIVAMVLAWVFVLPVGKSAKTMPRKPCRLTRDS